MVTLLILSLVIVHRSLIREGTHPSLCSPQTSGTTDATWEVPGQPAACETWMSSCKVRAHEEESCHSCQCSNSNKSLALQLVISSVPGSDFESHRSSNTTPAESFFQWLIYPTCALRAADFPSARALTGSTADGAEANAYLQPPPQQITTQEHSQPSYLRTERSQWCVLPDSQNPCHRYYQPMPSKF
ncbi:hypothetical protein CIB84_012136 [Bambusicola thoracicus]|uniref:Uncharacterized protein n=1 Tax=Bambusicola thoracicus TaxID=9083 RepID=A0A2P4SJ32_BAMTH|nr:hypothetical protein CIB84_012136 [Bambusicola thoracicus]